jgi:16S rRNA (guanine527-N7)-methyltransferase
VNPEEAELARLLTDANVLDPLVPALAEYGARLLATSRKVNLTGAKSAAELAPHLVDCLTIAPYVVGPLVDVGSGGGLPAIPLAIATGVPVTMIESTAKKVRFLEEMLAAFGLQGRAIAERAEIAGHDPALRGAFASATARAVSSAPTVLELVLPFLAPGGLAVLQRGGYEPGERNAAEDAALVLGAQFENEIALAGERRIVFVRKVAETNIRFPRRIGIPEKRPLCTTNLPPRV